VLLVQLLNVGVKEIYRRTERTDCAQQHRRKGCAVTWTGQYGPIAPAAWSSIRENIYYFRGGALRGPESAGILERVE
jgi:hypothetical protein